MKVCARRYNTTAGVTVMFRPMLPGALALLMACLLSCPVQPPPSEPVPPLGGRNEGTWYEIFTGSFYDSNGDGIGDLNGIAMKLDYLNDSGSAQHRREIETHGVCNKSLHIDGIWLTPIMPSPSYHKYDTKDYKGVDPQFGTMDDFRELLKKCHDHGIKLIIDLVMNHSSQDHPWFQKALEEVRAGKPGRYASYYNFYYGPIPPENETVEYKWNDNGEKYISARYFKHWGKAANNVWWEGSFWTGMPDLNWDSAALRREFKDVVAFWLDAGLDGFRLDATSWPYDYYGLGQMTNGYDGFNVDEKNIELWTWFNNTCRERNSNVYLVGECWKPEGTIANYYRSGMNFFAFQFCDMGTFSWAMNGGNGYTWANDVVVGWERTIKSRNPGAVSAMFLSNHDKGRSFYSFGGNDVNGDARRKMGAALYLMSPGTPFIYYGEEIGLVDYSSNNSANGVYADADHRGPMWWSNTNQAGTPQPPDERRVWPNKAPPSGKGVDEQLQDDNSLLRFYIKIINLKNKYPWLAYAHNIESVNLYNNDLAAVRVTNPVADQTILLVQNLNQTTTHTFNLPKTVYHISSASVFNNQDEDRDVPLASGTPFGINGFTTFLFREY